MSASPVTLMVARRVSRERYDDFMLWLREGEQLATDFPGYLGSGVLAPPVDDDEFQIVFRFADETTLASWEHSASRRAWLIRGQGLFAQPHEQRIQGIDAWFGAAGRRAPRWKQSVAIWLAFFPVSLGFNLAFGSWLNDLPLALRIFISTLALTPLMTYWFIPLATHWLDPWLHKRNTQRAPSAGLPSTH